MEDDSLCVDSGEPPAGPVDDLCDFIVTRHHTYLRRALPLIGAELERLAAQQVVRARSLTEARDAFAELAVQLRSHLAKEENLLFPAIKALVKADREGGSRPALPFPTVLHPIRVMEAEHARMETVLDRLRQIIHTDDAPRASWRDCLAELSRLDADLRELHRMENEILFPRALELERRLP